MSENHVCIEAVETASARLLAELAVFIPQLSTSTAAPDVGALAEIVGSPTTTLLVAREAGGLAVGMLTLVMFRVPTGLRAIIEDVVVDVGARRLGVGTALTMRGIALAREKGARTIDLTSRPSREAANRLYQRLGFERRETNVYRLTI
jgi:ribosomal protein S18 acetylase RimI-like enzyme